MTLEEIRNNINGLKAQLRQTDYKDNKLIEALAKGEDISEYLPIINKRQNIRDIINDYEDMIERGEYEAEPEYVSEVIPELEQIESAVSEQIESVEPIDGDIVFDMNVEED